MRSHTVQTVEDRECVTRNPRIIFGAEFILFSKKTVCIVEGKTGLNNTALVIGISKLSNSAVDVI